MKISFAQNYEDILIDRLFSQKDGGFYIDIGAAHPRKDSVTRFFYGKGWRGINVEPNESYYQLLAQERPRDKNLWCAVSDSDGSTDYFFVKEDPKISFIGDVQDRESSAYQGLTLMQKTVETRTVTSICNQYSVENIDFLKIDVEGAEEKVLKGIDFSKVGPRLIIIESVEVKGHELVDQGWVGILESAGYTQAYFDGINSYFVKKEDSEALRSYSTPLNASDNFIQFKHTRFQFLVKQLFGKN